MMLLSEVLESKRVTRTRGPKKVGLSAAGKSWRKKGVGAVAALGPREPGHADARPNCSSRNPKYHLIETIRPLTEVHWGG